MSGLICSRFCQSQFKISRLRAFDKLVFMLLSLVSANKTRKLTRFLIALVFFILQPFRFLPYFNETVLDEVKEVFRTDKR